MHVDLGGYHVGDVEVVSAFDIHAGKVGREVGEAIFVPPNSSFRFAAPPTRGATVQRGPTLDGIGRNPADEIEEAEAEAEPVDVAAALRASGTEVLVSYLPVGSQRATEFYAERALEAGCALVNCIPVFIASHRDWARRFEERGLPILGDDIKSQVGATIVHRMLANLFRERGVRLDRTYQLNFGGNTDFKNMLERERLVSKKISKTQAVMSQLAVPLEDGDVHVGPSDFVPWLTDRPKVGAHPARGDDLRRGAAQRRAEARRLGQPELGRHRHRCGALRQARARPGLAGPLLGPSSYFMKSPPEQYTDHEARARTLRFIAGDEAPEARLSS